MIFDLPGNGLTNSADRRSKSWIKRLDKVDRSKGDGWAFEGEFRQFNGTEEAPVGTFYMSVIQDVRSSGRCDGWDITLYLLGQEVLSEVDSWRAGPKGSWALVCRDEIANILEEASRDHSALQAERTQLLVRLAEIDKILGTD
jgi:hypothetical protein